MICLESLEEGGREGGREGEREGGREGGPVLMNQIWRVSASD
jgi:hypothetical protein